MMGTVTQIEQRMAELGRALTSAANEYNEAREVFEEAKKRWNTAQADLTEAKNVQHLYLTDLQSKSQ